MIPTSSSATTNGCDNISSNCVIWQGPDISCIDLCNGDTVSEVVAKLATEVCTLITSGVVSNPNLTGLDLTCLNIPGTTPTTLVPVLQAMVTDICANASSSVPTCTQVVDCLPLMTLPACMRYNDAQGNPVTELRLDLFATLIANQVCTNLASIVTINTTLTNYNTRLDVLEACVLPCSGAVVEAQVVPTCIINVGVLTNVSVLLLALEIRYCALETAVGLPAAINSTISQSVITSSYVTLTNTSVSYGSVAGWNANVVNLAQNVQNAWVVIDDMYTAIQNIQTNCCPSGCDGVTFRYATSNVLSSSGEIGSVNFNFQQAVIPAAFNDCSGSTLITITDGAGVTVTQIVNVSTLQNVGAGVSISVGALNVSTALSVAVDFCVTNGIDTCEESQTSTVPGVVPCPTAITVSAITSTTATVSFTNLIGVLAVYVIDILDSSNNVVATFTQNSPGATVTNTFTGLVPNSSYTARVTVTKGGTTVVCPSTDAFRTTTAAIACADGMDVAFVLDYTTSMSANVTTFQAGITDIITAVDTASGSNAYRLGLVLADEGKSGSPTYATSVEYDPGLPIAQRIINTGPSTYQYLTAVELFQTNNTTTFQTQLAKINTGSPTAGWPMGEGADGVPEPTDMAIGLIVEANAILGAFRATAAKYVIIVTDTYPSGSDDAFTSADITRLNSLQTTCALGGIKCFVFGLGVQASYTVGGVTTYPWQDFATGTGGTSNTSYSTTVMASAITNSCPTP